MSFLVSGLRAAGLLAAMVSGLLLAAPASAQFSDRVDSTQVIRFGLAGGLSAPVGDTHEIWSTGWHGQMLLAFRFPEFPLTLCPSLSFRQFDQVFPSTSEESAVVGTATVLSGLANASLNVFRIGSLQGYVTGGVGGYYLDLEIESAGPSEIEAQLEIGVNGGLGVGFPIGGAVGLVEGRVEGVFTDGFPEVGYTPSTVTWIPMSLGIVF